MVTLFGNLLLCFAVVGVGIAMDGPSGFLIAIVGLSAGACIASNKRNYPR